jgi:protein ImuA
MHPVHPNPERSVRLQELRARLQALERGSGAAPAPLALGLPALDRHLGGGLPRGCLHEVAGAVDDGAALGFCAALAGRLAAGRPVLWSQPEADLYAPGLAAVGLDPTRLILAAVPRPTDRLWAMEEGLRCKDLAAVVIELDELDVAAGRRLQLAAEAGKVTGLVLHPDGPRRAAASVAVTRWRVTSAAGHGVHRSFSEGPLDSDIPSPLEGEGRVGGALRAGPAGHGVHPAFSPAPRDEPGKWLGPACWQLELLRCRGGRPGRWLIELTEGGWRDATGDVAVAAALRDRPDPSAARA